MKPPTPEELYEDNEDLEDEGMLFIGEKGKILCDFRGNKPRLIPKSRQRAFEGSIAAADADLTSPDDEWVNAIRQGTKSKGSFEQVAPLAEAVTLAAHRAPRAVQAAAVGRAADGVHELGRGERADPPRTLPRRLGRPHRLTTDWSRTNTEVHRLEGRAPAAGRCMDGAQARIASLKNAQPGL